MMLVEPKDLAVGALVQARDSTGYWYNAKVIAKTGRGASHAALVRFIGFSKSHDAKFTAGAEALRERVNAAELRAEREAQYFQGRTEGRKADGTWEIERVLKVVRGQCLIRWKYWGPEWDSWEKGIDREMPHRRVQGRAGDHQGYVEGALARSDFTRLRSENRCLGNSNKHHHVHHTYYLRLSDNREYSDYSVSDKYSMRRRTPISTPTRPTAYRRFRCVAGATFTPC